MVFSGILCHKDKVMWSIYAFFCWPIVKLINLHLSQTITKLFPFITFTALYANIDRLNAFINIDPCFHIRGKKLSSKLQLVWALVNEMLARILMQFICCQEGLGSNFILILLFWCHEGVVNTKKNVLLNDMRIQQIFSAKNSGILSFWTSFKQNCI